MPEDLQIALMRPRVGHWQRLFHSLGAAVHGVQFKIAERRWDALLYPCAQRGFFQFKSTIERTIMDLKLD